MLYAYTPIPELTPIYIKAQKEALKQVELTHFNQYSVMELMANRTRFYDDLLIHLWQFFRLDQHPELALIAVGGYGREEMFPLSDLDILILSPAKVEQPTEQKIRQFIQFLWDCHFDVGQSVRTLDECWQVGKADITIATNLLESRYLCGNTALFEQLSALIKQPDFWTTQAFYDAKVQEKVERYQRYHNTSYNLEPDIKYSPGGLRDLHLLYWLALKHNGAKTLETILNSGFIYQEEYHLLQQNQSVLFKVRFALHLILKRYDNRLLFDRQVKVSELLGYQGEGNQAVEYMMKDFFQALQAISVLTDILVKHYREHFLDQNISYDLKPLDQHFQLINQAICLKEKDCFNQQPETILDLFFHLTQQPQAEIHSSTLRSLYLAVKGFQGELCRFPVAREKFIRLFSQPQAISRAFVPMHQYGVLNIYLPEWKGINGLMQFDLFHVYSVDEHTLRVMLKLESFLQPEMAEHHPVCHRIFTQLTDRTLLYIVALFHDIAKGRGGDHALLGAEDIVGFAQLHGFDRREIDTMKWLVEEHLLMSVTAQRRDIHDPTVVLHFANQVRYQVRLDYLTCLTVADINATNETLWNTWKRSLLATLYQYTSQQFRQGMDHLLNNKIQIDENRQAALRLLQQTELTESQINIWFTRFPEEYFLRNTPQQISWHTQLLAVSEGELLVKISNRFARGGTEVFIYCQDRVNLFNKVVTTIGAKQFSIHDAQILTSSEGYVFDSFIITELDGSLVKFDRRRELESALTVALQTNKVPKLNVRRNAQLAHFRVKTEVRFLNIEKTEHTEMELVVLDKVGLLADVSQIFSELHLSLQNAKITTVGEKAEDFFILTNPAGLALNESERIHLQERIYATLLPSV